MIESRFHYRRDMNQDKGWLPSDTCASETVGEERLIARSQQQALSVEVNAVLTADCEAEDALREILLRLTERTHLVSASVFLLEPERRQLRCVAQSGHPSTDRKKPLDLEGPGLAAQVARTQEGLYVPEGAQGPRAGCPDSRLRSEYAVPLRVGSRLLGVLEVASDRKDGIRSVTQKLVDQVASQVALAVERSDLHRKLRASETGHWRGDLLMTSTICSP